MVEQLLEEGFKRSRDSNRSMGKRAAVEFWTCSFVRGPGRWELRAARAARGSRTLRRHLAVEPLAGEHATFARLFETVRKIHRGGLFHGALTADNIIVTFHEGGREEFYIANTPRSLLFPSDISGTRMAEWDLLELTRALVRGLKFPSSRLPLEAYGMDPLECAEIVSRVYYSRRSALHDRIVYAEFRARWLLACAGAALRVRIASQGRTEVC